MGINKLKTMKTNIFKSALFFAMLFISDAFAQDVTTVRANNTDISDNLDLRAVASIFGESRDLEDFERRLNDPDIQISNLDLNGDNRVDYLRVIEATERNTHLIILQAVLGIDTYQDIATIEVERSGNNVQVQVVGDVYMYGSNYIYEPVYVARPVIFDIFWVGAYRPYYSPWYWGYYPSYYSYWAPYPVYRYRNHVHTCINVRNTYNYVDTRRSTRAVAMHTSRRANAYERQHPDNSFTRRNTNATNRYALEQNRESGRNQRAAATSRNTFNNSTARTTAVSGSTLTRNSTNTVRKSETSRNTNVVRTAPQTGNKEVTTPRSNPRTARATTPVRPNNDSEIRSTRRNSDRSYQTQPSRQSNMNSTPSRSSAPSVRSSAPAQRSTPSVRQSSPSPQRQSAPSQSHRSGSNGNGRSRG